MQLLKKALVWGSGIHLVLLVWILSILIVDVHGEFPLFDDWAYAKSVRSLLDENVFVIYDRIAITFTSNLIWGWIFTKFFGFSFLVLRISSIVAGTVLLITFSKWLNLLGVSKNVRLFCLFLLAFCPLFFFLSLTFMTDIFFLMNICLSLYFFTRFFQSKSNQWLIWAFLFVIIGILSRQVGIALPLAFALVLVLNRNFTWKQKLIGLSGVIASGLSLLLYYVVLEKTKTTPTHYTLHTNLLTSELSNFGGHTLKIWAYYFYTAFASLCTLLLPLSLYLIAIKKINWKRVLITLATSTVIIIIGSLFTGEHFPFPFNGVILNKFGVGTYSYMDAGSRVALLSEQIPYWFEALLPIISCSAFFYLILENYKTIKSKVGASKVVQLLLFTGMFYYPTFGLVYVFDRYLTMYMILLIPVFIILFSESTNSLLSKKTKRKFPAYFLVLLIGVFMIIGTRDYFEYNRVKWKALNNLMEKEGVAPKYIDGGNEFNAWLVYEGDDKLTSSVGKEWWCVEDDKYLVTVDKRIEGYKVYSKSTYKNWLGSVERNVYILERKD